MDGVNLDTCDREPIHLIGRVQPHGALIAMDAETFIMEFASANTAEFVGAPPEQILGRPLADLIGQDNAARLPDFPLEPMTPEFLRSTARRSMSNACPTGTGITSSLNSCTPKRARPRSGRTNTCGGAIFRS